MNRRRFLAAVGGGITAVLAGCSLADPPTAGGGIGTGTETVTPVPVSEDEAAGEYLEHGLTRTVVADPEALERTHRDRLAAEGGYRARRIGVTTYPERSRQSRAVLRVGRNATNYWFAVARPDDRVPLAAEGVNDVVVDEPVQVVEVWFTASGAFRRVTFAEGGAGTDRLDRVAALDAREVVSAVVSPSIRHVVGAFPRVRVSPGGGDGHHLEASVPGGIDGLPLYPGDRDARGARLLARVTEAGLVDAYRLRYVAEAADGVRVARNSTVEFSPDAPARLDPPAWAAG